MSNSNDVKPTVEELRCKLQEEQSRTSYSRNKCTNYQTQLLAQGAKIVHLNAESVQTANALLQERQVQKSLAAELTEARAMLKEEHAQVRTPLPVHSFSPINHICTNTWFLWVWKTENCRQQRNCGQPGGIELCKRYNRRFEGTAICDNSRPRGSDI
jgi:hypothetical protein